MASKFREGNSVIAYQTTSFQPVAVFDNAFFQGLDNHSRLTPLVSFPSSKKSRFILKRFIRCPTRIWRSPSQAGDMLAYIP